MTNTTERTILTADELEIAPQAEAFNYEAAGIYFLIGFVAVLIIHRFRRY